MNKKLTIFYVVIMSIVLLFFMIQLGCMWGLSEKPTELFLDTSPEPTELFLDTPPEPTELFLDTSPEEIKNSPEPTELFLDTSPTEFINLSEFTVTAYCPCVKCCGRWALGRPHAAGREIVFTASGAVAREGVTVAVDTTVIPYDTAVWLDGYGVRIAQDTGVKGHRIDIYFDDHAAALEFGQQILNVWEIKQNGK